MHGTGDNIVPYGWLGNTNSMETTLNTTTLDGLIKDGTNTVFNNTPIPVSSTYATTTQKHLIKKYNNAPHGWDDASFPSVRADVITWLNGHK